MRSRSLPPLGLAPVLALGVILAIAAQGALAQPEGPGAGTSDDSSTQPVLVLRSGERLACHAAPVVAFGRVLYTAPDGVRRALAQELVDLDATREANARATPAAAPRPRRTPTPAGAGRAVPSDIVATTRDGETIRLSDMKGDVVLVEFWASWCGPCIREMPHVEAAWEELHEKDFQVLGVSLDRSREAMERFVETRDLPWPQSHEGSGWDNPVANEWGVRSIPRIMLIGRDGRILRDRLRGADILAAARAAVEAGGAPDGASASGAVPADGKTTAH